MSPDQIEAGHFHCPSLPINIEAEKRHKKDKKRRGWTDPKKEKKEEKQKNRRKGRKQRKRERARKKTEEKKKEKKEEGE
jgi:cyclic nucleotide gated channel alpha 1